MHINSIHHRVTKEKLTKRELLGVLISNYVKKHFSLWGDLKTKKNINQINKSIEESIKYCKGKISKENIHLI